MPIISVIVPIYNAEKYLSKCITSIINQSFIDIEVLLVNDGSTDDSIKVCERYRKLDSRIKVFSKENKGVSHSRNYGISKAKGEFVCFVDADDEIDKNMLEILYNDIKTSNADLALVGHRTVYINGDNKIIKEHKSLSFAGSISEFLNKIESFLENESIQGPCGKLYKLAIIKNNDISFPLELSFGEDTFFVYRYLWFCKIVVSSSSCSYSYIKVNENSLSSSYRENKFEIYLLLYEKLSELLEHFGVKGKKDMIENRVCLAAVSCIGELYTAKNNKIKKKKRKIIDNILSEEVIQYFNKHKTNRQNKIISLLASKRLIGLIELYFILKEYMKKNFKNVYNSFRD